MTNIEIRADITMMSCSVASGSPFAHRESKRAARSNSSMANEPVMRPGNRTSCILCSSEPMPVTTPAAGIPRSLERLLATM
ncbi:hypothetical protein [Thermomonospora umbrina]|uniref:hypothetical protein n=1 Tax=Thermomonospora umbrina TaxID=111806 RepID=UPI0011C18070|nr:hypothetical protein [Thermomonospora umbrina]